MNRVALLAMARRSSTPYLENPCSTGRTMFVAESSPGTIPFDLAFLGEVDDAGSPRVGGVARPIRLSEQLQPPGVDPVQPDQRAQELRAPRPDKAVDAENPSRMGRRGTRR
ncbi:hypothetical protein GCM10017559_44840 [Streptosporangium longisporum]|uniref:Uncharacterized protein n=1 Tax=Streptosporangium longisporum TaxID=46187 RepID=A0ABN3Y460_9ACTN